MKLGSLITGLANTIPVSAIINFASTVQGYALNTFAAPTGPVAMNSQRLTGLGAPSAATDAATKTYADTVASNAQTAAQNAANSGDTSTLNSAKAYADTGDTATLNSAKSYADGKVAGVAKVARGTFVGNGTVKTFDLVHNLGVAVVNTSIFDSAGNLVLLDTPPKSGATTTTAVATFDTAPLAADGTFQWVSVG